MENLMAINFSDLGAGGGGGSDLGGEIVDSFFLNATSSDFRREITLTPGGWYSFAAISRTGSTLVLNYYKQDGTFNNALTQFSSLVSGEPKTNIIQIPSGFTGIYIPYETYPFSGALVVREYAAPGTDPLAYRFVPDVLSFNEPSSNNYSATSDILHYGGGFAQTKDQTWGLSYFPHPTDGSSNYVGINNGGTNLWTFPASSSAGNAAAGRAAFAGYSNALGRDQTWWIWWNSSPETRWNESATPIRFDNLSVSDTTGTFFGHDGSNGSTIYTGNLSSWTSRSKPSNRTWTRVASSPTTNIALCDESGTSYQQLLFYSTNDGASWSTGTMAASPFGSSDQWKDIVYGEDSNGVGRFVAVSWKGAGATSTDNGATWTTTGFNGSDQWRHIVYGEGIFMTAKASSTQYYRTENGSSWTYRGANGSQNFGYRRPAFGDSIFMFSSTYSQTNKHTIKTKLLDI
jgi:hypothetical protein